MKKREREGVMDKSGKKGTRLAHCSQLIFMKETELGYFCTVDLDFSTVDLNFWGHDLPELLLRCGNHGQDC